MPRIEIPNSVIGAVSEIVGHFYYSHSKLNSLFMEAGAPGDPPDGNCVAKCMAWLQRCNTDQSVEPLVVLGSVIQAFMDTDFADGWSRNDDRVRDQERIRQALARNGFAYQLNGHVLRAGASPSTQTLADILRRGDLSGVDAEFRRALSSVESDPPAALTAACALLESLFKIHIEDQSLDMPERQTIKDLWRTVRDHLGLEPGSVADEDIKRVLSGLASIVDGIGSLRTHAGSAHGRGRNQRRVESREARLAINAAHTLAVFIIEARHAAD